MRGRGISGSRGKKGERKEAEGKGRTSQVSEGDGDMVSLSTVLPPALMLLASPLTPATLTAASPSRRMRMVSSMSAQEEGEE